MKNAILPVLALVGATACTSAPVDSTSAAVATPGTRSVFPEGAAPSPTFEFESVETTLTTFRRGHPVPLYRAEGLIAEFTPAASGTSVVASRFADAARVDVGQAGVQVWRVEGADSAELCSTLRAEDPSAAISQVFTTSPNGEVRALAGGVLVRFDSAWSDGDVEAWVEANGLTVAKDQGNGLVVLDAPAGIASLELANELHGTEGLTMVAPNWWRTVSRR